MMNELQKIEYKPIGIIHTAHKKPSGMPIQPHGAKRAKGTIELDKELMPGLIDIEGFSHLILVYHFHKVKGHKLYVEPFMDNKPHGIFATRAPVRPNPIGISIVKLKGISENQIYFEGADMLDETPLLDIKPFFAQFDNRPDAVSGWLDEKEDLNVLDFKSDGRFSTGKKQWVNRCK
jgi:tRNA-Thr(GGU) m(6)t(6)A37 methyltransferase TsaA